MKEIPGYKIISMIGEGGMAIVYKGLQVSLNRPVAIKILKQKLIGRSTVLERFNRESLIIARLHNPHIIHVIDRGVTDEGMPYFVMEHIEGTDLESVIRDEDLDFNRKVDLVIQICKALAYAHKNGVIHRDIKPSNVLIDGEGHVQVLDFGIAQFYGDEETDVKHTQIGSIMGTPEYMSPEQRTSSDTVTALSDLYSLGVLMYELFTGTKPIGRFHLPAEIDPTIPEILQHLIMACLEADPEKRPASADEVKDKLLKILQGAHLKTDQKTRASHGISDVKEKFALLDVIKEETHGAVYLYEDRNSHKLMVIKKRPSKSRGYHEAKVLTKLRHKNIANILGTSKNASAFIIVMEYLSGGSLKDRLARPYELEHFLTLAKQISEGLYFAHNNSVLHGNLRPTNVLFTSTGSPKITDFGLDEHYLPNQAQSNWYNPNRESKSIQGDILAAGAIFFQMITGTVPEWIDGSITLPSAFEQHPIELQAMLIKMLSVDKKSRYSGFDDVIKEIDGLMSSDLTVEAPTVVTTVTDKVDEPEAPPPPEPVKPSVMRLLQSVFLVLILIFAALVYLTYTGDIYGYIHSVKGLWLDFTELIKGFP